MDTTVVIPTVSRPSMLRTALASVARQSALHRITCVHVSENGGDLSSAAVCKEFPQLPIRYSVREPRLPLNPHFVALMREVETPCVAVLHDDDWWAPHHLAQALADLDAAPSSSARYSAYAEVAEENSPGSGDNSLACWLGAGYPSTTGTWKLTHGDMMLACLSGTPTRYSCLVARRDAILASLWVFELGNPFDTDRMLAVALAQQGSVLFDPVPAVFIRRHARQDGRNYDATSSISHMTRTTRWIIETARAAGVDIAAMLGDRLATCPAGQLNEVLTLLRAPWCVGVLKEQQCLPETLARFDEVHSRAPAIDLSWRAFIPPIFLAVARKIKTRIK